MILLFLFLSLMTLNLVHSVKTVIWLGYLNNIVSSLYVWFVEAREILECRKRGCKVRLILDYSNIGNSGCQVISVSSVFVSLRELVFLEILFHAKSRSRFYLSPRFYCTKIRLSVCVLKSSFWVCITPRTHIPIDQALRVSIQNWVLGFI